MIKILFICHGRICQSWQNPYKSNVFCISYSILPMIYQYFQRARPAIIKFGKKRNLPLFVNRKSKFNLHTKFILQS